MLPLPGLQAIATGDKGRRPEGGRFRRARVEVTLIRGSMNSYDSKSGTQVAQRVLCARTPESEIQQPERRSVQDLGHGGKSVLQGATC